MKYFVYIIQTIDNTLYCGITNDLNKRYNAHLNKKGAKYTAAHPPQKIVYVDVFENKSDASKEEYRIKKTLSRDEKLKMIEKHSKSIEKYIKNYIF